MPAATLPLSELAERLALKETELTEVRSAFEARLKELRQRREELEFQLRQVDLEIQSATQPSTTPIPLPAAAPVPKAKAAPDAVAPKAKEVPTSLPKLIVLIMQESRQPMSVKELAEEVTRRKYPTTSSNLSKVIGNRVSEMLAKGILKHAPGNAGVIPAPRKDTPATIPTPAKVNGKAASPNGSAAANGTTKAPPAPTNSVSLRDLLTILLTKSTVPLKARQLAEQALATGYQSNSKKFIDVVWTALGQMDNVENIAGKGYRLKKRPSKAK